VTIDGILARPPSTAQAHDLGLAIGKVMRSDRTFEPLRNSDDMLCVEIRPTHRDKVLGLLGLSPWSWGEYVRRWEAVGLAHRCPELDRGAVRLFPRPEVVCPICGESLPTAMVERGSEQRSTLLRATENVLTSGDASRDEEGDRFSASESLSQEGLSESAPTDEEALANLKRILKATPADSPRLKTDAIGEPLSDDEVRELGFEPTWKGWVPRKARSHAA
jgi:hypothetical protein